MISRDPLYITVKNDIWEGITEGRFADTLPTEHELCEIYGVSRATIRSAIQELKKENVVRTVHGIGTFVNKPGSDVKMRIDKFKGFYHLVEESGHAASVEDIGQFDVDGLDGIRDLPPEFSSSQFVVLERIIYSDDTPAMYIMENIPKVRLRPGADLSDLPHSILQIVDEVTETHISYTISEIQPVLATEAVAGLLQLERGMPINMVRERHHDVLDDVVVYSEVYVNSDVIRFNILRAE